MRHPPPSLLLAARHARTRQRPALPSAMAEYITSSCRVRCTATDRRGTRFPSSAKSPNRLVRAASWMLFPSRAGRVSHGRSAERHRCGPTTTTAGRLPYASSDGRP